MTINVAALMLGALSWSEDRRLQRESAIARERVRAAERRNLEERQREAQRQQEAERLRQAVQTETLPPSAVRMRTRAKGEALTAQKSPDRGPASGQTSSPATKNTPPLPM